MTEQTTRKIDKAIDRALEDLGITNYEAFIASVDGVILFALCRQFKLVNVIPQLANLETMAEARARIESRDKLRQLLDEFEEPSPAELNEVLLFFKRLPPMLKQLFAAESTRIRPRGGPREKLNNPVDVVRITDEFFDRQKAGERPQQIKEDIAKREDVSLSTVERRLSEELERRAQLKNLANRSNRT